jgi:predicted nucleic acid-binding protein
MSPTVLIDPPSVFLDSGGFIGLHVPEDQHHEEAIACRDKTLRYSRLYTSSAVVAETIAHIQRDRLLDQQNIHELINDFLQPSRWISLLTIDDGILERALQMVQARNNRRFGVVDATNLLLMERHRIDIIFAFDALYDGESILRGHGRRFVQRIGPAN